jgi:hypothetical protein
MASIGSFLVFASLFDPQQQPIATRHFQDKNWKMKNDKPISFCCVQQKRRCHPIMQPRK